MVAAARTARRAAIKFAVAGNRKEGAMAFQQPVPLQPSERIAQIDILRGFALLGIFMVNITGFYSSSYLDTSVTQLPW